MSEGWANEKRPVGQKRRTQDLELEDAGGVLAPPYTNQVTLGKS